MAKQKDLRKGIHALFNNLEPEINKDNKAIVEQLAGGVQMVDIDSIETNPFQPRLDFEKEALAELTESIKTHGLVQPITIRAMGDGKFQLISGERRLRASKEALLKEIPAFIRIANDQEMLEFALIENIIRKDLNPMEIAFSFQRLMMECELTQEELSPRVGKNRSTISNYIRLLKLPPQIQQALKSDDITMGHAKVLAGIQSIDLQLHYFHKCIYEDWSVRKLESMTKGQKPKIQKAGSLLSSTEDIEIQKIKKQLQGKFDVEVKISKNHNDSGKISFVFDDMEEFNDIVDQLL